MIDMKKLGAAAVGGALAGVVVNYADKAKPAFLSAVPTAAIPIILGALIGQYGKGASMKDVAAGMVAYGAGELASGFTGPMAPAIVTPVASAPGVAGLISTGIQSNPGHYNMDSSAHVGNLLVTVK